MPLDGVRVIDCSRVLAGPYCGVLLAHLGADVIKVEHLSGDEARSWPPHHGDMGASFLALNSGKRGIAVDLKSAGGSDVVHDLAAGADVLVENFKTGDMERFGLGFDDLRAVNPRLVYTSISAFGRRGPRASDPGYEALLQAYSGVMAITGETDGRPVRCGVSFLDMATGTMAALATVTALLRRTSTGRGGRVEASLLGTSVGLMSNAVSNYLQHGLQPPRHGSGHPQVVPYEAFATADGHVMIAAGNQNLYERLCRALDRRDLVDDPRFVDNPGRVEHRAACVAAVAEAIRGWDTGDLIERLGELGVPVSPVNDYESLMADGQVDAIGVLADGTDPAYGEVRLPALPFSLSGLDMATVGPAPRLGEHTTEVLTDVLGYDDARIGRLFADGVVGGV
ncbi:MAG: CaiB/BaiF CoA transferase family protein [Acidimicrobiales bacterium]